MNHELKTDQWSFRQIWDGNKPFEIRDNRDRGFQKGDTVTLKEIEKHLTFNKPRYTGREIYARISFVTGFQQKDGYVVMGLIELVNIDINEEPLCPE